jgi:photosystem II stability/assembly factor-like uncharacterized protein
MGKSHEFDPRLKAYLSRGASTPPPAGMEARILGVGLRRKVSWGFQVAAAAAVLVLAIGLGIILQRARQSNPIGGPPTATALALPSVKPTVSPTPTIGDRPYPLLPPDSMQMISATTGWAAGSGTDRILRTTDGGSHWDDVTPPGARAGTWTAFFLDANNAWLASSLQPGSGSPDFSVAIYRTADGGRSWQHIGQAAADQGWPASMAFVDRTHGWLFMRLGGAAGSDGVAFYGTVDGGSTWSKLSEADTSGNPGHLPLRCSKGVPVFLNGGTGWMPGACNAGGGPFLYVTHDAGRTWNDAAIALPAGFSGNCICAIGSQRFSDARNGVFVLTDYSSGALPQSVIYATTDAGNSWRPGPALPAQTYEVYFIDRTHGWTVNGKANNSVLYTADGGQHWSTIGTIPSTQGVQDLQFVNATVGWAMGSEPTGNTLITTSDGGQTWTTQLSP